MTPLEFKTIRLVLGDTQEGFGIRLGLSGRSIQRIESGGQLIPKYAINILALTKKRK